MPRTRAFRAHAARAHRCVSYRPSALLALDPWASGSPCPHLSPFLAILAILATLAIYPYPYRIPIPIPISILIAIVSVSLSLSVSVSLSLSLLSLPTLVSFPFCPYPRGMPIGTHPRRRRCQCTSNRSWRRSSSCTLDGWSTWTSSPQTSCALATSCIDSWPSGSSCPHVATSNYHSVM